MQALFIALRPGAFLVVSMHCETLTLLKITLGPDSFVEIRSVLVPWRWIQA